MSNILAGTIAALSELTASKELREKLLDDFTKKHALEEGVPWTPETQKALADHFADAVMKRAREL